MRTRLWLAPLLMSLLATGCTTSPHQDEIPSAGGAAAPRPTASLSEMDQAIRYAQCVRSNGVPMSDPQLDSAGNVQPGRPQDKDSLDAAAIARAQQQCRQYEPVAPPGLAELKLELSREFSRCMRAHGVEHFPDPENDAHVEVPLEVRDDPEYAQAEPVCDEHVRQYTPSPR
ncbi:hypothetical protein AB0J74_12745 [Asanoa sp. NPDC049573]|uniref:hypothetical protein n=1 Tax=Asanoa sp. NPDC049573 TaxID=3155396 RepID=UPI00341F57D0